MTRIIFTKYACPQCRQLVQVTRMTSMFIFDVVEWSDGEMSYSHGNPDRFDFLGCPACEYVGRYATWHEVRETERNEDDGAEEGATGTVEKSLAKMKTIDLLLARTDVPPDERKEILLGFLGAVNHLFGLRSWRSNPHEFDHYDEYTAELVSLLPSTGDDIRARMLRAEVLRERAEYAEAIRELDALAPDVEDPHLRNVIRQIRERAEQGTREVFALEHEPTEEELEEKEYEERWPALFRFIVERDTITLADVAQFLQVPVDKARRYFQDMREELMVIKTEKRGVYRIIEPDVHNMDPWRVFMWYTLRLKPRYQRMRVRVVGEPVYRTRRRALDVTYTVRSERDLEKVAEGHWHVEYGLETTIPLSLDRKTKTFTLTVPYKRKFDDLTGKPVWK